VPGAAFLSILIVLAVLATGMVYFHRMQDNFADII
jgi:hypothetical protein